MTEHDYRYLPLKGGAILAALMSFSAAQPAWGMEFGPEAWANLKPQVLQPTKENVIADVVSRFGGAWGALNDVKVPWSAYLGHMLPNTPAWEHFGQPLGDGEHASSRLGQVWSTHKDGSKRAALRHFVGHFAAEFLSMQRAGPDAVEARGLFVPIYREVPVPRPQKAKIDRVAKELERKFKDRLVLTFPTSAPLHVHTAGEITLRTRNEQQYTWSLALGFSPLLPALAPGHRVGQLRSSPEGGRAWIRRGSEVFGWDVLMLKGPPRQWRVCPWIGSAPQLHPAHSSTTHVRARRSAFD